MESRYYNHEIIIIWYWH